MSKLKSALSVLFAFGIFNLAQAQIAVNADGSQPDASAMLEIKSDSKGLLIPRLTTAQRTGISSPATGLLVFDSSLGNFWYYTGSAWASLENTDNQKIDAFSLSGTTLSLSLEDDAETTKTVNLSGLQDNMGTHTASQNVKLNGYWLSNDGGNEGVYVTADGNVGAGTSTPNAPLEVRKDQAGSITQLILTNRGTTSSGTGSALVFRGYRDSDANFEVGKIEMQHKGGIHADLTQTADMIFYTRGLTFNTSTPVEHMRITSTGNIGIGTTTPTQGKVVINGSATNATAGYGYLNKTSSGFTTSTYTNSYSLYANAFIAAAEFNATSDSRIKNIIGLSDAGKDLKTLMALRITDYTLRDTVTNGTGFKKKVIAQEVREVYPQAVNLNTDVIPDIYKRAAVINGWVQLATDLKGGEKVQLITDTDKQVYTVLETCGNSFRTDYAGNAKEVFVFGRQVNDFHNVDYEALSMLNVSATQEMYRLLEKQQDQIKAQQQKLTELETKLQKVDALEAALKQFLPATYQADLQVVPSVPASK